MNNLMESVFYIMAVNSLISIGIIIYKAIKQHYENEKFLKKLRNNQPMENGHAFIGGI
jgi:hypothetical protein